MITSAAKRIRLNECAELAMRTSLIWMRFGTSDHIFNIHDVQLIIIFISLTKIKDIVENLDDLPNRILPNLAHLLILCVFTSFLCESIKKWRKITTTTKNQIQSWPFIYKLGEHKQQSKGGKNTKLRAQWVRPNVSEAISVWNCCNVPAILVAGSTGPTMRRLDNLKR
jgi:hypothetical protein